MSLDKEFVLKIKKMSFDELKEFRSITSFAKRICTFSGVSSILIALFFTNIFTVALSAIVLISFGQIAVKADEVYSLVNDQLLAKEPK